MRNFFVSAAVAVVSLMIFFAVKSLKHRSNVSGRLAACHLIIAFSVAMATLPLFVEGRAQAMVITSLYYASIDWLLIAFSDFLLVFIGTSLDEPLVQLYRTDSRIFAALDSFLIMSSFLTEFTFSISARESGGVFLSWTEARGYGFTIHSFFDYAIVLSIGIFLLRKFVHAPKFNKRKIASVFLCLVAMMLFNSFFMLNDFPFRYSVLSYALVSIAVYYVTFVSIPLSMNVKIKNMIAENISNAVLCFDAKGECIFMNKFAVEIFSQKASAEEKLREFLSGGEDFESSRTELTVGGEPKIFDIAAHRLRDKWNREIGTYMTVSDISSEISRITGEVFRSTHDPLTRALNRTAFFEEIDSAIAYRPNVPRYLLSTNIKNFKLVNDFFGSKAGDDILKEFSKMLSGIGDENSIFGRISGDRFALLMEKDSFSEEKLIAGVEKVQEFFSAEKYTLQVSVGVYEIEDPFESVFSMCDKATLAMRRGEAFGRLVSFYDSSIMDEVLHEKSIIDKFNRAFALGEENCTEFRMYLQPQVSSATEKAVGAEALVRWVSPEGMIPPDSFVPILENTDFIYKVDHVIWIQAAKKLSEWKARGIDLYIAVNISARDFYYLDLYRVFTGLVEEYGISPKKLRLEITETAIMDDMKMHSQVIESLREYGFLIEMDDFGSGYSSLNLLKNMKMDVLKVDMAFMQKTDNQRGSRIIVESVISMAKELGMTVITEGVESREQTEFLAGAGCDIFQGYLYSRPIPPEEFEAAFAEARP